MQIDNHTAKMDGLQYVSNIFSCYQKGNIKLLNADCMEVMKLIPDLYFDFAIVDPEYGIGASEMQMGTGKNKKYSKGKGWDKKTPTAEYFAELKRVSKKQIIWGGNYFELPKTNGWIVWDKELNKDVSFSDCELAWTNFLPNMKIIRHQYSGFLGADLQRIHITQKPIKLYEKVYNHFTDKSFRVLDTHGGSFSSAIAAYYFGFSEFIGCEIDAEYFEKSVKRFEVETMQQVLAL